MEKYKKIVGAAFGDPLSYGTFSGYSYHFFDAMKKLGVLYGTQNTRDIRFMDIFRYGAVDFKRILKGRKPNISSHWLWRPSTVSMLSLRMQEKLKDIDERIPFVQVGTHVWPVETTRDFYCVTDMTILQAAKAGQFKIKELSKKELDLSVQAQQKMFDSYKKIFVLCSWTKEDIVKNYNQPDSKVIVIGAGANIELLEPADTKFNSKEILFIGFDWQRKGGPVLLEAFKKVKQHIPNAKLNIVGCNPCIDEAGVQIFGRLHKDDHKDKNKLNMLFRNANCFCILPEFDPFPNVLLEAQKSMTPVVSWLDGSRTEAVVDQVTGILVARKSADDVAEALLKILSSPEVARDMGYKGREFILNNFTWEKVCLKVLNNIE